VSLTEVPPMVDPNHSEASERMVESPVDVPVKV